jgi:hypothetical protein
MPTRIERKLRDSKGRSRRPPFQRSRIETPRGRNPRHTGVAWHTPYNVHYGQSEKVRAVRAEVLTAAYTRNPERFVRKPPEPAALPVATWINKPAEQEDPHGPAQSTKS